MPHFSRQQSVSKGAATCADGGEFVNYDTSRDEIY